MNKSHGFNQRPLSIPHVCSVCGEPATQKERGVNFGDENQPNYYFCEEHYDEWVGEELAQLATNAERHQRMEVIGEILTIIRTSSSKPELAHQFPDAARKASLAELQAFLRSLKAVD